MIREKLMFFLRNILKGIDAGASTVGIMVILGLICCMIVFAIVKLKKTSATLAIVISSLVCALLMVPATSLFNHLLDLKAIEKKPSTAELESTIDNLNKELEAYKHAQLNLQSFNEIAELALFEAHFKTTEYRQKTIDEQQDNGYIFGWGKNVNKSFGREYMGVYTYDLNPKFGIDLKEIKVKEDGNNILVGTIKNKYIGTPQFQQSTKLSEIRKFEKERIESGKYMSEYKVLTDKKSLELAHQLADQYRNEFQERLSKGLETDFIDDAVIRLSSNFITLILNPMFDKNHIMFTGKELEDGLPILDYLNSKIIETEQKIAAHKN